MLFYVHELFIERGEFMAKETLKGKIARLEHDLEIQRQQNSEILQKLYQIQDENDKEFANSPYCKQLEHDIETYKQYKELYEQCNMKRAKEHDDNVMLREEIHKLKYERDQAWQDISSLEIEKGILQIENKQLMTKDVESYETAIHKLIKERNELLLKITELKKQNGVRMHNERGAGRKPSMTSQEKQSIINDRAAGMTFKQLSEKHGYSVGIIHKLISESQAMKK